MTAVRHLDWDDLRYLLAVARGAGLAGAARSLGVNPSTVFRRLNALVGGNGLPGKGSRPNRRGPIPGQPPPSSISLSAGGLVPIMPDGRPSSL